MCPTYCKYSVNPWADSAFCGSLEANCCTTEESGGRGRARAVEPGRIRVRLCGDRLEGFSGAARDRSG